MKRVELDEVNPAAVAEWKGVMKGRAPGTGTGGQWGQSEEERGEAEERGARRAKYKRVKAARIEKRGL